MTNIIILKQYLKRKKINIKKEEKGEHIPELIINNITNISAKLKIYNKTRSHQRTKLFSCFPFMIKNHDWGKVGLGLKPIDELRNEVRIWKKYKAIPITPKIAILKLEETDESFLVEKLYEEFNKEVWEREGLIPRMKKIQNKIRKKWKIDDKPENFVYDREKDKLFLVDICDVHKIEKERS